MIIVVTCVWQRPERLEYTLTQLSKQTFRNFEVILINNNRDLKEMVRDTCAKFDMHIHLVENEENRGPYARLEAMVENVCDGMWFMTIDDDAIFDETLLQQWWNNRLTTAVQGWNGFIFKPGGTYWERDEAEPNGKCHYLWGSNLFIPPDAIRLHLLQLPQRYWQCDDLWLCYVANCTQRLDLIRRDIQGLSINIDNKDTYLSQANVKVEFLELLRHRGWSV